MDIMPFLYDGEEVRTIVDNGSPWFVAKDVCEVLDIKNPTQAVGQLDSDERAMFNIGRQGETNIINEPGLYSLILRSRKPEAKRFKRWITHEVIPTIRKTGGAYLTDAKAEELINNPDLVISLAQQVKALRAKNDEQAKQIEKDRPKTIFADAVSTSDTSILVGELAKLIRQNGYEIGQNRLFDYLRDNGYLIKSGSSQNMPTQRSMEAGWFEIKERSIQNPDGSVRLTKTSKVTGKGQLYFVNHFLGKERVAA